VLNKHSFLIKDTQTLSDIESDINATESPRLPHSPKVTLIGDLNKRSSR